MELHQCRFWAKGNSWFKNQCCNGRVNGITAYQFSEQANKLISDRWSVIGQWSESFVVPPEFFPDLPFGGVEILRRTSIHSIDSVDKVKKIASSVRLVRRYLYLYYCRETFRGGLLTRGDPASLFCLRSPSHTSFWESEDGFKYMRILRVTIITIKTSIPGTSTRYFKTKRLQRNSKRKYKNPKLTSIIHSNNNKRLILIKTYPLLHQRMNDDENKI